MISGERLIEHEYAGVRWLATKAGGYLLALSRGQDELLFPDQTLRDKRRGGLFVALPQFGPDKTSSRLPQHGFGRTTEWTVGRNAEAVLTLTHERQSGPYAGLVSSLNYRFNRAPNQHSSLYAGLTLHNDSDTVMRIAPAFHPYIDISRLSPEGIQSAQQDLDEAQTVTVSEAVMKVSDTEEVAVRTTGFERMTWWTDALGGYVCIEPSLSGPSFSTRPHKPTDAEVLEPGDIREFDMSITWRPIKPKNHVKDQSRRKRGRYGV